MALNKYLFVHKQPLEVDNLFISYGDMNGCYNIPKLLRILNLDNTAEFQFLMHTAPIHLLQAIWFLNYMLFTADNLLCRIQPNNFRFEKCNYGIGLKWIFNNGCQRLSTLRQPVVHRVTTYNFPYICRCCPTDYLLRQWIFSRTYTLSCIIRTLQPYELNDKFLTRYSNTGQK